MYGPQFTFISNEQPSHPKMRHFITDIVEGAWHGTRLHGKSAFGVWYNNYQRRHSAMVSFMNVTQTICQFSVLLLPPHANPSIMEECEALCTRLAIIGQGTLFLQLGMTGSKVNVDAITLLLTYIMPLSQSTPTPLFSWGHT
ncbi:hypothetical protein cypCar_00016947 [Cyprinus carpio]|nr:hypothetical protein cypCar_00016947 [Cyprinus carpio]